MSAMAMATVAVADLNLTETVSWWRDINNSGSHLHLLAILYGIVAAVALFRCFVFTFYPDVKKLRPEVQRETVSEVRSHIPKFRVECRDAADRSGWGNVEQQPCWVIMLEVLDNLPHDLIYAENQISSWTEVWVERQHDRRVEMEELL